MDRKPLLPAVLTVTATSAVLMLSGCFGGSSSSSSSGEPDFELQRSNVDSFKVVDANSASLSNADVGLVNASDVDEAEQAAFMTAQGTSQSGVPVIEDFDLQTDSEGLLQYSLEPGVWYLAYSKGGAETKALKVTIGDENAASSVTFTSPLSCGEIHCKDISGSGIVGSVSGVVYDSEGPIAGADVRLWGGEATNGTFSSAQTDEAGAFSVIYNVSKSFEEALEEARIRVVADGYETVFEENPLSGGDSTGVNFKMVEASSTDDAIVWQETFELDSPTRNDWTEQRWAGASWEDEGLAAQSEPLDNTYWQLISSGSSVENELVDVAVLLPPDDESHGALPVPRSGEFAYWYGNLESGNFIGERADTGEQPLDGGTSTTPHGGSLTSPAIDLSAVEQGDDLSVTFDTYWEIEAVNPNDQGFDLMGVEASTSVDGEYETLVRLNPLSDPASSIDRAPLAFTNRGFNQAASWEQVDPIDLSSFAGEETVYLRFRFETVDGLYNGFRGWLINDLEVRKEPGIFPPFEGHTEFEWGSGDQDSVGVQSLSGSSEEGSGPSVGLPNEPELREGLAR